jgi:hypothetical protein
MVAWVCGVLHLSVQAFQFEQLSMAIEEAKSAQRQVRNERLINRSVVRADTGPLCPLSAVSAVANPGTHTPLHKTCVSLSTTAFGADRQAALENDMLQKKLAVVRSELDKEKTSSARRIAVLEVQLGAQSQRVRSLEDLRLEMDTVDAIVGGGGGGKTADTVDPGAPQNTQRQTSTATQLAAAKAGNAHKVCACACMSVMSGFAAPAACVCVCVAPDLCLCVCVSVCVCACVRVFIILRARVFPGRPETRQCWRTACSRRTKSSRS